MTERQRLVPKAVGAVVLDYRWNEEGHHTVAEALLTHLEGRWASEAERPARPSGCGGSHG